jgi:hypothetical protein
MPRLWRHGQIDCALSIGIAARRSKSLIPLQAMLAASAVRAPRQPAIQEARCPQAHPYDKAE